MEALFAGTLGLLLSVPIDGAGQSPVQRSAYHDYRVVTLVDGLEHPWSIAFLPGGDMLVTERPGRLRIVRDGKLLEVVIEETLVHRMGRVRDVRQGPDGYIYVAIDGNERGTRLPFTGSSLPTRTRLRIRGGIRERSGQNSHSCPGRTLVDDSKDPPQAGG